MLLSIGYRFQQRVTQKFIDYLKTIQTDNEFYRVNKIEFMNLKFLYLI
jgi:hypothetical protein